MVGNVLRAASTAPSAILTTWVHSTGLTSQFTALDGQEAIFTSDVTFTGETDFQEVGHIKFGDGNLVYFSTVGSGYLAPSADPTCRHGMVMWQIDRGEGQFMGATGLITSNFTVNESLEITHHHVGVLFLP